MTLVQTPRSAQNVDGRLAEFLLSRQPAKGASTITLGMTQQAVAEELGTVRGVVSRTLRRFASAGMIESVGGGRFRVLDRRALERIRLC